MLYNPWRLNRRELVPLVALLTASLTSGQEAPPKPTPVDRMAAEPANGFHWAYFLYAPPLRQPMKTRTLLVVPNNTGKIDDDPLVHDRAAKQMIERSRSWADKVGVLMLVPTFPRPKQDWRVYTQALDRDTLLTAKPGLERLDRQLLAMIDHARQRLQTNGSPVERRVLLFGFSASGMFVNRFVFLHPDRVKAAAIGSPGGWPIAPVAEFQGRSLRYPVGVADLERVAGTKLDTATLAQVPLFLFMGDQDTNDSVIVRDSYDDEDETLIGALFGKTPVERWPVAQQLYRNALPQATFKLYPGAGHKVTPQMMNDLHGFLSRYAQDATQPTS